jgi:hypothetical protein
LAEAQKNIVEDFTREDWAVKGFFRQVGLEREQRVDIRVRAVGWLSLYICHCHRFIIGQQRFDVELDKWLSDGHQTK